MNGSLAGNPDICIAGVSTDTRSIQPGDLFIALRGERFDGNDYIQSAFEKGAEAAIVSRMPSFSFPCVLVEDTGEALRLLAAHHRRKFDIPVIAITGSVGKTTAKDMLTACLQGTYETLKTAGNMNNEIGLPLTLLKLTPAYTACVVELGMRGRGEIAQLAEIAKPTASVIVSIDAVHLERLGSLREIALAKSEVLPYTGEFAVIDGESAELSCLASEYTGIVYRFGGDSQFEWVIEHTAIAGSETIIDLNIEGSRFSISLPMIAPHLAGNAAAAVGTAMKMGVAVPEIQRRLSAFQASGHRLNVVKGIAGATLIDDCYNASPRSMAAALQVLHEMGRDVKTIAVLGDMFELGTYEVPGHKMVGKVSAQLGVDQLVLVGCRARHIADGAFENGYKGIVRLFERPDEALHYVRNEVQKGDVVLVKASRGMQLETIVEGLTEREECK